MSTSLFVILLTASNCFYILYESINNTVFFRRNFDLLLLTINRYSQSLGPASQTLVLISPPSLLAKHSSEKSYREHRFNYVGSQIAFTNTAAVYKPQTKLDTLIHSWARYDAFLDLFLTKKLTKISDRNIRQLLVWHKMSNGYKWRTPICFRRML